MNGLADARETDATVTGVAATAQGSFARLRLILVLGVAVLFVGIGLNTWSDLSAAREAAINGALRHAGGLISSLSMHAAATFRVADMAALTLARAAEGELVEGRGKASRVSAMIAELSDDDAPYRNLVVTDALGNVRYDGTGMSQAFSVADREFFHVHRGDARAGTFISDLVRSRLGRGWFVAVSRRVNNPDGSFAGVAYAVLDLSGFERHYEAVDVGDFGFISLWAAGGKVLARMPVDQKLIENPGAYAERIASLRRDEAEPLVYARSPIDDVDRWVMTREVDGFPLRVSIGIAERDVLGDWERAFPRQIVTSVATAVLVLALAAVLFLYLSRLETATDAWRESEKRFRALFDSTFGLICLVHPDGRVVSVNRAMHELVDCPETEVVGQAIWTLSPWSRDPAAMRQMREGMRRAGDGEFVRYECELSGPHGLRAVDISVKPLSDDRGLATMLVVEARDVTDRKRVEDNLRVSEARSRSYFDAAMEGILVADRAGRFIDANPAACRVLGYDRETLLTRSLASLLPDTEDPGRASIAHIRHVLETGSYRGELRLQRRDGDVRIAEISAARVGRDIYLGVFRDVTERRRDTEALKASNARIAALIRALPDMVNLMDAGGAYVEEAALAVERSPVTVPGIGPGIPMAPPVAAVIRSAVTEAVGSRSVVTRELLVQSPAGSRWVEARFSVTSENFGSHPLVLSIVRDITDRVEAAERLAAAKEQAETANRTKSAFLATMSHELRTPLNAIIGFSEIMRSEMFGPVGNDRYRGYLDNIHESGSHLLALINDVLDVSKLEAGKYMLEEGDVDVAGLVESCCALHEESARAGELSFTWSVQSGLPPLIADDRAARQVLLNMISNAIKFTPTGGEVSVRAHIRGGGGLAIVVSDTGIGIPEAAMDRIAKPFQQVDSSIARRYGGTGLGLAIVRNLMELHGGRVMIDSVEGEGTTVTVLFPPSRLRHAA